MILLVLIKLLELFLWREAKCRFEWHGMVWSDVGWGGLLPKQHQSVWVGVLSELEPYTLRAPI